MATEDLADRYHDTGRLDAVNGYENQIFTDDCHRNGGEECH